MYKSEMTNEFDKCHFSERYMKMTKLFFGNYAVLYLKGRSVQRMKE